MKKQGLQEGCLDEFKKGLSFTKSQRNETKIQRMFKETKRGITRTFGNKFKSKSWLLLNQFGAILKTRSRQWGCTRRLKKAHKCNEEWHCNIEVERSSGF